MNLSFRAVVTLACLSLATVAAAADKADTKVTFLIVEPGDVPDKKILRLSASNTGRVADLDGHEVGDEDLKRLLANDHLLADDKNLYVSIALSNTDRTSVETLRSVMKRVSKNADPKKNTTIYFVLNPPPPKQER